MKKLITFFTMAIAAIVLIAVPTSCSTDAAPQTDEEIVKVESRDAAARQFIRQYKISFRNTVGGSGYSMTFYMISGSPMPFDTTIWYDMEATYYDGETENFVLIPTIYAGTSQASPIYVPVSRPGQVASVKMIDATILQPTEW